MCLQRYHRAHCISLVRIAGLCFVRLHNIVCLQRRHRAHRISLVQQITSLCFVTVIMKEALISEGPKVRIVDTEIPKPAEDQIVIKVVVSGSNPKDWKYPEWNHDEVNQGDDIAGIVHAVGPNITEYKVGDRVAAFHQMFYPHGSYSEYAIAWQHTTFHIPKKITFEGLPD